VTWTGDAGQPQGCAAGVVGYGIAAAASGCDCGKTTGTAYCGDARTNGNGSDGGHHRRRPCGRRDGHENGRERSVLGPACIIMFGNNAEVVSAPLCNGC
jgi:hypothetical protein